VTSSGVPFLELILACGCSPTWPLERIRRAAAIGYLQRHVFIKRRAFDWIPTMIYLEAAALPPYAAIEPEVKPQGSPKLQDKSQ
jgi:hypothetical protein